MAILFSVAVSGLCSDSPEHEIYAVDASGGVRTRTLPDATKCRGALRTIVKSDASANAVIVNTTSAQPILAVGGSATSKSLAAQGNSIGVVSDGVGWAVIATT